MLKQVDIKRRWRDYFFQFFNEDRGIAEVKSVTHNPQRQHEVGKIKDITTDEVRQALGKMGKRKAALIMYIIRCGAVWEKRGFIG